jgi:cytochrome c
MERDMFDTMTMTKIVGGFCGAFLIFLLGKMAGEFIYEGGEGGHGENKQAYVIAVPDAAPGGTEEVVEGPPFEEVYAAADAVAGEALFRNCQSCHSLEAGKNMTGPSLHGVVGRAVDTAQDYAYSGALEKVVDVWTPEHIYHFIENPRGYAPGTKMTYAGMRKPEDRANLIAYLATNPG